MIFIMNALGSAKQFRAGVPGHINDGVTNFVNIPLLQYS